MVVGPLRETGTEATRRQKGVVWLYSPNYQSSDNDLIVVATSEEVLGMNLCCAGWIRSDLWILYTRARACEEKKEIYRGRESERKITADHKQYIIDMIYRTQPSLSPQSREYSADDRC